VFHLVEKRWTDLSEGNDDYVSMSDLPAAPAPAGVRFIDLSTDSIEQLARTFNLVQFLPIETLLTEYVIPAIESRMVEANSEREPICYVLQSSAFLSKDWKQKLSRRRVIPSRSEQDFGVLNAPRELYDPTSRHFRGLFFADETVFPDDDIFEEYKVVLMQMGLHADINVDVIKSRVRYFEGVQSPLLELKTKGSHLMQKSLTDLELTDYAFCNELRSKRWVPATKCSKLEKLSPKECRPQDFDGLVNDSLGLIDFPVSPSWCQLLGWDMPIGFQILITQLSRLIEENKPIEAQKVLEYIEKNVSLQEYIPKLRVMKCIPGSQGFYWPYNVLSSQDRELSRLAPMWTFCIPLSHFRLFSRNSASKMNFL
jgi:hypothetical protein